MRPFSLTWIPSVRIIRAAAAAEGTPREYGVDLLRQQYVRDLKK